MRYRVPFALAFVACLCGQSALAAAPAVAQRCTPSPAGTDSFCSIGGVRLHYVDWGGEGPAIILLAGLGDSARIFDDLAPRLAHGHRVIALTRRGYGRSDHSQTDYSNRALVGDVLGLMDALGIDRASFVGHSIAGGELSAIGAHRADRVERLVYLDAAYDQSRALELMKNLPATPEPGAADRASVNSLARWEEALLGTASPAIKRNVADTMQKGEGGLVPNTPPSVMLAVIQGDVATKPDYAAIAAPALALYGSKDVADQVAPGTSSELRHAIVDYQLHRIRPWMLREQAEFLEHKSCGTAVELPHSTHYFFLTRPDWTARVILQYLASPSPCDWQAPPPPPSS